MPRKAKNIDAKTDKMREIETYEHKDKQRANNPPIGMAHYDKSEETQKTYAYDPHIDPSLQWAGKAEGMSFDVPTSSIHIHESKPHKSSQKGKSEMKRISMIAVLVLVIGVSTAFGFVFGGSNLGVFGYPEFNKFIKPTPPFDRNEYSMRSYKSDVESYLDDLNEYIENANNDRQRIVECVNQAKREADNVVDEYNRFVRK